MAILMAVIFKAYMLLLYYIYIYIVIIYHTYHKKYTISTEEKQNLFLVEHTKKNYYKI
jgi:hypothetical protein